MANQRKSSRRPASSQRAGNAQPRSRRRPQKRQTFDLRSLRRLLPAKAEFKPDAEGSGMLKVMRLTRLQQLRLLKWVLYAATLLLALVIQDVIMSHFSFLGATTDLPVCVILMITIIEGTEIGSLFVLITSLLYYFSGSSPGPYTVAVLTFLGMGATLLRQALLHRSPGSIVITTAATLTVYEIATFVVGLLLGLTHWGRLGVFLLTGILSSLVCIPLYPLIHRIGLIGGNTWKE